MQVIEEKQPFLNRNAPKHICEFEFFKFNAVFLS